MLIRPGKEFPSSGKSDHGFYITPLTRYSFECKSWKRILTAHEASHSGKDQTTRQKSKSYLLQSRDVQHLDSASLLDRIFSPSGAQCQHGPARTCKGPAWRGSDKKLLSCVSFCFFWNAHFFERMFGTRLASHHIRRVRGWRGTRVRPAERAQGALMVRSIREILMIYL